MNCEEITDLMDAYLDGELDPITSQKVARHLQECSKCEQAYEVHTAVAHAISQAPYHKAPTELRKRIQSSLRDAIGANATSGTVRENRLLARRTQPERRNVFSELPWNWLGLAAAIILAAALVSTLLPRTQVPTSDQFLATQLIASHVRSLMASHLTDVASSDQHTVKPWLDVKLDFAAPVVDLSSEGFPLIGGRLDYLDNRPVAALVYQRRKHFINLFVWPAKSGTTRAAKAVSRQGYHLLHWVDSDFNYWAVSDVSPSDLQAFREQFEGQLSTH
jgi:mycothiol system anti-sigma-R factor